MLPQPTLVLVNDHGETSNNRIIGGSSQLRAKFTVARADAAGKGITGLVGLGISAVYMHTSQTPDAGNPNPADGYIQVVFSKGFSKFQGVASSVKVPQSGASLLVASAGLVVGTVYVITILGTTTQAQWEILGVPAGVTAALGVAFVAIATSCTGTGAVQVPATAGAAILSIQAVGDPAKGSLATGEGAVALLACYGAGGAVGAHTHSFLVKGGQAAATTDVLSVKGTSPVVIGKEEATDKTALGGANGGVQDATPTFTGANAVVQPADGTEIELCFNCVPLETTPLQ